MKPPGPAMKPPGLVRAPGKPVTAALAYSLVLPTKDRPARALAAVEAALDQTRLPAQIIVVDASDPPLTLPADLQEAVRAAGVELLLLHAPPSTSGQRNRGIEATETPLVLLLDDDVTLQRDYVEVLLERWQHAGLHSFSAMVGVTDYMPPQGPVARTLRRAFMLHYQAPGGRVTKVRRSGKLCLVAVPKHEVTVPVCGAGYGLFRTDLLRRDRFDERFEGYAPGEDLDLSTRLAAQAPILQVPAAHWVHQWDPRERTSPARWHRRGLCETYFRLRHLDGSAVSRTAFAVSLLAEAGLAAVESLRERDRRHVVGFTRGVLQALRERDA